MTDLWRRLEPLLAALRDRRVTLTTNGAARTSPTADFASAWSTRIPTSSGRQTRPSASCERGERRRHGCRARVSAGGRVLRPHARRGRPDVLARKLRAAFEFDAIGITLPHELAATNVLEALDLCGPPAARGRSRAERSDSSRRWPLLLNPEPYAPFFDTSHRRRRGVAARGAALACASAACAQRSGYPARACGASWTSRSLAVSLAGRGRGAAVRASWIEPWSRAFPTHIEKRLFSGFAESPGGSRASSVTPNACMTALNVEVLRGCARGCRFCQAGMMYRPVRERSADNIVKSV